MIEVTYAELERLIAASPAQTVVLAELFKEDSATKAHFEQAEDWASEQYNWRRIRCPEALHGRAGKIPVYYHCLNTGIVRRETVGEFYGNPIIPMAVQTYQVEVVETIRRVVPVSATTPRMAAIFAARQGTEALGEARMIHKAYRIIPSKRTTPFPEVLNMPTPIFVEDN